MRKEGNNGDDRDNKNQDQTGMKRDIKQQGNDNDGGGRDDGNKNHRDKTGPGSADSKDQDSVAMVSAWNWFKLIAEPILAKVELSHSTGQTVTQLSRISCSETGWSWLSQYGSQPHPRQEKYPCPPPH
jgi:hypothetical protein